MKIHFSEIEGLLPEYLSGEISETDRAVIENWRNESHENELLYLDSLNAWEAVSRLRVMEQFNSFEALKKVTAKLAQLAPEKWWMIIQRVAVVLLLPLLVYSGYMTIQNQMKGNRREQVMMQTVISRQGMVSQFVLSDGTKVWLNSDSRLLFPMHFVGDKREVILKGEAFFEIAKNEKQPFRVNANELYVEALGTSFDVASFDNDTQSEVVLVTGKVELSSQDGQIRKELGVMSTGQRAIFLRGKQRVFTEAVEVEKYIAWREGNLVFRNDSMEDVVKRLNRWFNVAIVIDDPEIKSYRYKATFRNESLKQVLHLLKLSAPIDYLITESEVLPDGEFTKQKIYLMKRK